MPDQQQGQGEPRARSSWHQRQVQFAGRYGSHSAPCSAGMAGAGQVYQDGGQRRWVWGRLGTGPAERHHGRFGASLPEPWFNQSRERE